PGKIRRLTGPVKIPHIGWDEVTRRPGSRLFAGLGRGAPLYFVHSSPPPPPPPRPPGPGRGPRFFSAHSSAPDPDGGAVAAVCDYGGRFAAAVEHGNLFGTQFHPEKSGAAGLALLGNFV